MARAYESVALVSPATVPYRRYSEHGAVWFLGSAFRQAIHAAGVPKGDIDGLTVSSYSLAPDTAISLADHFGMTLRWVDHVPMGGASGVIALRRAARAIQAGDAQIVACLAGDTLQKGMFRDLLANFSRATKDAVHPYGVGGANAVFAMITRAYMDRFGAIREDFGRICIAQRENARHNPLALLRDPLSLESYIAARPIAEPLHLYDCVMPCAGAEAFIVMAEIRALRLGLRYATILATDERHNAFPLDDVQLRGGWAAFRDNLYDQAGLGPEDMNFVQAYDDYPVIVLLQLEDLGFCAKGDGPCFLRRTNFTCSGGGLPLNSCGGQLSAGQAGFAGGFLGTVEAIRQLTGQCLGAPVPEAIHGIVSGYGMAIYDRGLCCASAILRRGRYHQR